MTRTYEGVVVLNIGGKEDVENFAQNIGQEIESEGAKLHKIEHIGLRKFPYNAQNLERGYYVNYTFEAEPSLLDRLRKKLKLNEKIHLQHYQKTSRAKNLVENT